MESRATWLGRALRAACVLGLAAGASGALGSVSVGTALDDAERKPDKAWDDVLAIGRRGGAASRNELQAIAGRKEDAPSVNLARKVLSLWKEGEESLRCDTPQPLAHPRISAETLRQIFPGKTEAGVVVVSVSVNSRGLVTDAKILSGPSSPPLDALVLDTTRGMLFCPVKRGSDYVPGTVTLTFRLEVR